MRPRGAHGGRTTNISLTIFDLAGIVALLLWGVHMVETGIQRAFGAKLRTFLAHQLRNRGSAFLAGLGITAILQSSTATGLMVTGFAREGLVGLAQGLAVMLGANVGSTLIVQLLSFDVTLVAPILVLAGYLLFRRARAGARDFGRVLIGLGLVLFALHQFLALLDPLTTDPMAKEFLAALSSHIVFIMLIAALLTWAVHSSVAVVLLAMSFASQGVLDVPAGIAMALGANLGTAVNPLLEGGGKDVMGRRLPLGNLITRLVGVLTVLALYPLVPPFVMSIEADPARAVADFHTGFNLVLAAIFFPLLTPYAKLLERLFRPPPEEESPDAPRYLQPVGGDQPATLALGGAARETLRLTDILEEMLAGLRRSFGQPDRRLVEDTRSFDDQLDQLSRAIKENLVAIDTSRLDDRASQQLARILTFSVNLEQAGDLIDRGLLGIANRRLKRGIAFSAKGQAELIAMVDRLQAILRASAAVFLSGDLEAARKLAAEKETLRQADEEATAAHFERLRSGEIETAESSALHLDALRDLRSVGSHLIEGAAYPILKQHGDLLPTRLKAAQS